MDWSNKDQFLSTADFYSGEGSLFIPSTVQDTDDFPELDIPNLDFTSDFTIEFFVKTTVSGSTPLEVRNETTNARLRFYVSNISLIGWSTPTSGDGEQLTGVASIVWNDRWIHLGVTFVASTNRFYFLVDGKAASKTDGISDKFSTLGTNKIRVGKSSASNSPNLFGYVDALRVSQEALYTSNYTVPDPSTWSLGGNVLYYDDFESPPLVLTPGAINVKAVVGAVEGAVGYKLTYQASSGSEVVASQKITNGATNIESLVSETEYTVRLYVDTGSGYELTETETVTTLENIASNYNVDDFKTDGTFSLSSLSAGARSEMSSLFNDLFTTGDKLELNVGSKPTNVDFVKRGETIDMSDSSGIFLPFDPSAGASQSVSLQLSDNTTIAVDFDEANNTITVDSETYSAGTSFILDNKKITIVDYE